MELDDSRVDFKSKASCNLTKCLKFLSTRRCPLDCRPLQLDASEEPRRGILPGNLSLTRSDRQFGKKSGPLGHGQSLNVRLRNHTDEEKQRVAALTESILLFQTLMIQPCELFRVFVSPLSLVALLSHVVHFYYPWKTGEVKDMS